MGLTWGVRIGICLVRHLPRAECYGESGFPFHAGTVLGVANGIRIGIRCRACGAEWTIDAHTDTEFLHTIDIDRAKP